MNPRSPLIAMLNPDVLPITAAVGLEFVIAAALRECIGEPREEIGAERKACNANPARRLDQAEGALERGSRNGSSSAQLHLKAFEFARDLC